MTETMKKFRHSSQLARVEKFTKTWYYSISALVIELLHFIFDEVHSQEYIDKVIYIL